MGQVFTGVCAVLLVYSRMMVKVDSSDQITCFHICGTVQIVDDYMCIFSRALYRTSGRKSALHLTYMIRQQ